VRSKPPAPPRWRSRRAARQVSASVLSSDVSEGPAIPCARGARRRSRRAARQVSASVLSSDAAEDPETLAINAALAALAAADVPSAGPAGAVRVASLGGRLVVNPKPAAAAGADLTLLYAGTAERVLLLQLEARPREPGRQGAGRGQASAPAA